MTDLLGLGAQGVRGYSRALSTVGDNIANAQTPGFARRATVLAEQVASGQAVFYRNQVAPGGVVATGVTRAVDAFLIDEARASSADSAQAQARLGPMAAVEAALDDGGNGVGRAMTALFNRADELAADATNPARRSAFLHAVDDAATTFRRTAEGLARAAGGVASGATGAVTQLNTDTLSLQRVNDGLRRARDGSSNQATLLDERDRLLDSISATLPVTIAYDARGAATLTLGGDTLLSGNDRATVTAATNASGAVGFMATGSNGPFALRPTGGALMGLIEAADHIGTNRSALDIVAIDFAAALNARHAAGRTAGGAAGAPLLTGTGAADLVAVALSARDVAAADATSGNGNALSFATLRSDTGAEARWATIAAQQSQAVANGRAHDAAATTRRDGAASARADVSGIDLDREAADLVRFQQAYQASARVIQAARDMMQTILSIN